jgi:uncharacterized damage-inducible protein DinB
MLRALVAIACLAVPAAPASAQENPFSTEVRQAWTRTWNNVVAAAEKMPEEHYGFKPAAESQSFRDMVAHIADAAMGTCSGFSGERRTAGAREMTSKADLAGAIKAAGAECEKAYASLTDQTATQMVTGPRGSRTRLGTLYGNVIHIEHEYAKMTVHFRLKGLVPPSSEGRR